MQLEMTFLETSRPAGAAPVWATLDEQQRTEVVTALARLIAKVVDAQGATDGKEKDDE